MISFKPPVPRISAIASTFRPPAKNKPYAEFQRAALDSWRAVADRVLLFNTKEELAGMDTAGCDLIEAEPSVKAMCELLASSPQFERCILTHGDIILTSGILRIGELAKQHSLGLAWAASAPANQYDIAAWKAGKLEGRPNPKASAECFVATRHIWAGVAKSLADNIIMGRPGWNWMVNDYLRTHVMVNRYHDISGLNCIWHPAHSRTFPTAGKYSKLEAEAINIENLGPPKKRYV